MNLPEDPHHNRRENDGCPYQELYIYYLEGRLKPVTKMFRDNFIGNWEEENFSFLFFSFLFCPEADDSAIVGLSESGGGG